MPWKWVDEPWQGWNKAWRPAGSGTTTKSRRERIRAEAQERDRLAAEGDPAMIALKQKKEASKKKSMAQQEEARQEEDRAWEEAWVKEEEEWLEELLDKRRKRQASQESQAKESKEVKPCQKADDSHEKPCQKTQTNEEKPCQKAQIKEEEPEAEESKEEKAGSEKPVQKAEGSKEEKPCQKAIDSQNKELGQEEKNEPKNSQGFGPSEKEQQRALTKGNAPDTPSHSSVDWGGSSSESSSSASSSSHQPEPKKPKGVQLKVRGAASKYAPKPKEPEPLLEQKQNKKIAVDWHGVLVNNDYYDVSNTCYLQALKDQGYEVHLLSYCGVKRSKEVWQWAWHEWEGWESVSFTWSKLGKDGKATWCVNNGVTKLIDDNQHICRESQAQGIRVYPIVEGCRYKGDPLLKKVFRDFKSAVNDILSEED